MGRRSEAADPQRLSAGSTTAEVIRLDGHCECLGGGALAEGQTRGLGWQNFRSRGTTQDGDAHSPHHFEEPRRLDNSAIVGGWQRVTATQSI
jgi:hypothetical protein